MLLVGAMLVSAVLLLGAAGAGATHTDFHGYSYARESSRGHTYVGVSVVRPENNPGNLPSDGCSQFFSGHPVYQTQWIVLFGRYRWIEFGTGHQCRSQFQYRFAGYAWDADPSVRTWRPTYTQRIASPTDFPTTRRFSLFRSGTNDTWGAYLDGPRIHSIVNWRASGVAEAGLESYQPTATVGKHQYGALQFRRDDAWHRFDSQDFSRVTPRPQMCGTWSSNASNAAWFWYAAQSRTC